jgi:DNA-binding Lrp family transcriptional regulator
VKEVVYTLASENVPLKEIINFIAKTANLPKEHVRRKVEKLLEDGKVSFNYRVFQEKEEAEKSYFLQLARQKPLQEIAEVYAEMAVMLERVLILNSFYAMKIRKLEAEIRELRKALRKIPNKQADKQATLRCGDESLV